MTEELKRFEEWKSRIRGGDVAKKLHLGSGQVYLPGYINCDLFSNTRADVYHDITNLPYAPESFDEIYCCHCIEHVGRHKILATLSHWKTLLVSGGILKLAVPDFAAVVRWYQQTNDIESLIGLVCGGQRNSLDQHTMIFDELSLTAMLEKVGFVDVKEWDWRTTEHAAFDDYASAYLPLDKLTRKPLDKENGVHVSLNLQATRP